MRLVRDPDTGQIQSIEDDDGEIVRRTRASGVISGVIPAADNAGGTTTGRVIGDEAEVIDAGEFVDSGEVFTVHAAQVTASLGLPTTATAEGSGAVGFVVAADNGFETLVNRSALLGITAPSHEVGIVDVMQHSVEDGNIMLSAGLKAEPSHSDTTGGVSGGADYAEFSEYLPFHQTGTVYHLDESDEVYVPFELETEGVSDHKIAFTCNVNLYGAVREV